MRARTAVVCVLVVLSSATAPATAASALASSVVHADGEGVATEADGAFESMGSSNAAGTADADDNETIHETVTLHRLPDDPGTVGVTLEYRLPERITALEVESPYLRSRNVVVESTDGFDRRSMERFVWDESVDSPTITLEVSVASDSFDNRELGVETDDWAFAYLPDPFVNWRFRGSAPEFEGTHTVATEGYATGSFGLVGGGSADVRRVGEVNLTLVVAPDARPESSNEELAELYRLGGRELDAGTSYENTTLFVLPTDVFERRSAVGTTVRYSVWVQDEYSSVDSIESTPAHEYVHTRMGTFRSTSGRWLTEASAEYYGALLSMNADNGNWTSFQESLAVERESVRESTLTVPLSWRDTFVPYEKGSRVLAALDAEIRERTDGSNTLQDVLAYRFEDDDPYGDLDRYESFADAVVAVTDDPEMRDWLERYVDGDEVPPLPEDPDLFVLNESMDSDGDGVQNGLEVATNPFDADSDGDGVEDGADAYPTDASRSEQADVVATNTTTTPGGTDARTATGTTTRTPSVTTTASTRVDSRTTTSVDRSSLTESRSTVDAMDSSTSTGDDTVESTTASNGQGSDAAGGSGGFGAWLAVLAIISALFLTGRRRSDG